MHIREARVEDSAALARVQVDSYRTAYADLLPASYLAQFSYADQAQDWRDLLMAASGDLLYVVEAASGPVVGYALTRLEQHATALPYESELVALHVLPASQRQGMGRALVAAVAQRLSHQGVASMLLWVLAGNPARGFYERLGGRLLPGQKLSDIDGAAVVEVAYGWSDLGPLVREGPR